MEDYVDKVAKVTAGIEQIRGLEVVVDSLIREVEIPDWFPDYARRTIETVHAEFETELVRLDQLATNTFYPELSYSRINNVEILTQIGTIQFTEKTFLTAAATGNTSLVRLLLQDPRIDPTAKNNAALRNASENNFVDVIRVLLADGRANPAAKQNAAIKHAIDNGNVEIVRLLLADGPQVQIKTKRLLMHAKTANWKSFAYYC
jgi:hypothetical protein